MIQGLRTVIYPVTQLLEATDWYRRVLDKAPYFEQPFYVGFEVGGFELGLVPDGVPGTAGATVESPVADVGDGIKVATVRDPYGNLFGIIENPHFDRAKLS
jgi:catechol 2,3-dioxygenase-like lactoylglutathione lyase family enzyme